MKCSKPIGRRSFLKYSGGASLAAASVLRGSGAWSATATTADYADSRHMESWLRHPVYGDPSFDTFERPSGNPILTGAAPHDWPVNGFLFADPVSGNLYIYVGDYPRGYIGSASSRCLLLRSKDDGRSWESLGVVLHGDAHMFDQGGHTPDATVVFDDGRYHMIYDWVGPDWKDGGLAYAWADRPEGPWHRDPEPITRNSTLTPLLGKYQRTYAGTLVRRRSDWLILAMMDHAPYSWAMFAMSAAKPGGPYSKRTLIRNVEADHFYPPLIEYFPAFVHGGCVYAPGTSVARNRSFQLVLRAPLESATDPQAWEMAHHGSVWHSEDVSNEAYGIWGQTFSGWVDRQGILRAMFPSRDSAGYGTINLAERPWARPLRRSGFHFSGDTGPSVTCLRRRYSEFTLNAALRIGGTARIVWSHRAPFGPDQPTSDATLHPLSMTRHQGLELAPNGWRVLAVDERGAVRVIAKGVADHSNGRWNVTIARTADGATSLALDGKEAWTGALSAGGGAIGVLADPHTRVFVDRFAITGRAKPGMLSFLYTDAWLGAGESPSDWVEERKPIFRFGTGAVRRAEGGRAKWNFMGSGFTLWSPSVVSQ